MAKILDEILKNLPEKAKISDASFEAANIVLYTKNKDFFFDDQGLIREIVNNIKKRIELRPDPSLCMDMEKAKILIEKIVPAESLTSNVIFDPQRSRVIIESEKPGLAIGKQGEILKEIKKQTLWVPTVRRTPAIRSKIIDNIRQVLYEESEYRKKFLNKVGHRIYDGWIREKKHEWVRLGYLGAAREVGRSCLFLQTPESRILLDCGLNPAATSDDQMYPYLDAPEFKIEDLDAVIVSHSHLDHCLHPNSLIQLGDGTIAKIGDFYNQNRNDIKCLDIDDKLSIEDWKCFEKVKIPSPNNLYKIKTKTKEITVTGEHPFFLLDNLKIIDKKAREIKKGDFIATARKIPFKGKSQRLNDIIRIVNISEKGREILKNERLRRGLKQSDVADKIGCAQVTISFIEQSQDSSCNLNLFKKLIAFYGLDEKFLKRYSKKKKNLSVKVRLPIKTNKELLQFLGYLIGDGCKVDRVYKGKRFVRVEFTDKDISNLESYREIGKKLFSLNGSIIKKDRNRLMYFSTLLLDYINNLSNKLLCKSPYREIPELVHKVTKKELSGFLRGLYDAEGSVGDHHIILTSTSKNIVQITQMLLLRYGILSHIYKSKSSRSTRDIYQLSIYNPKSIKSFKNEINFSCLAKKLKLEALSNKVGNACAERMDLIPLSYDKVLDIAKKLKLRKTDLKKLGINYYHFLKHNPSRKKLRSILNLFRNQAKKLVVKLEELNDINRLVNSDIIWDSIKTIEEIKSDCDYVYDLKVAGHHNYIANGIVVHNCGLVPFLYKMGYRGPCYMTAPTRDISALLALDYIEVAFKEAKKSIYTSTDIKEMVKHTICLDYEEVSDITPDIRLTFYNAGHTIGSAMSHLHIGNGLHNYLYSGDLKFGRTQLLESASVDFPRLETVSIESTYGGKEDVMPARHECEAQLIKIIKDTIERKGKVLMPVLGVGRSQEVLLIIENAIRNKLLEKIPVYVHGMVWDVTAIHTAYPDFLSKNIRKSIFHKDENPFLSDIFLKVGSRKEQDEVINEKGPCVIMATSGMMSGGPSVEYFKALAENTKNSLVLTCYQGEGSLGRRIQQGEKTFTFANGEKTEQFKMGMEVHTINGLSGHSSRQELIRFIYSLNPRPKRIIVNHGESSKCLDLASSLHKINKIETSAPRNLEIIRIK